jgi:hypothetical protein
VRKPLPQELPRQLVIGLGRVGARAIASAVGSVLRDGERIVKDVDRRISRARARAEALLRDTDDDEPRARH